ncbi:MAG: minor capsid protein [Anaerovoracaceae bacterium]
MRNDAYWRKRFELLEQSQNKETMELLPQIDKAFTQAQGQVEQSILKWLQRFADNNKVSMVEARKMLNARELKELRWSVEEYIKHGEENALNGQWVKQLENASARAHISRFEALTLEIQNAAEVVYGNHLDMIDEAVRTAYTEGYYQSIFEVHKGIGMATTFATVDDKMLSKVVNKPWAPDGQNFSQRVWKNRTQLVNELHNELTRMCLTGEGPDRAIKNIANRFQVSRSNAANLIQTESAFAASVAKRDVFDELDIEEYKICATLDNRTSAICQEMDGKTFSVKDFAEGVTAPPFHPRCRTTTMPAVDDEWMEGATRIARGEDGKNYSVPADMKYKDWKKKFAKDATPEPKHNGKQYQKQFAKYKAIFGKEIPSTLGKFQEMKYNNSNKWGTLKSIKQEKLNQMDFKDMKNLVGKLGDKEARMWYKVHDEKIPGLIDRALPLEWQARQACELRNQNRTQTRDLMKNQGKRKTLDRDYPNESFEKLIEKKRNIKHLTYEQAVKDILETATKTNKKVNKILGVE